MDYFQAIIGSILPNALNKRFRVLVDKNNEQDARLDALEASSAPEAETVAAEESQTVVVNETPVDESQGDLTGADDTQDIDEKSQDHPVRVEAKAAGVSSWHTKSIKNLQAELAELKD